MDKRHDKLSVKNQGAKLDSQILTIEVGLTKPKDLAGDALKKNPPVGPPTYTELCKDFLGGNLSVNANFSMSDWDLDPIYRKFLLYKKKIEDEIEMAIECYLPDSKRPIALAIKVLKRIKELKEAVECSLGVVRKIQQVMNQSINALTSVINQMANYLANQMQAVANLVSRIVGNINQYKTVATLNEIALFRVLQEAVDDVAATIAATTAIINSLQNMPQMAQMQLQNSVNEFRRTTQAVINKFNSVKAQVQYSLQSLMTMPPSLFTTIERSLVNTFITSSDPRTANYHAIKLLEKMEATSKEQKAIESASQLQLADAFRQQVVDKVQEYNAAYTEMSQSIQKMSPPAGVVAAAGSDPRTTIVHISPDELKAFNTLVLSCANDTVVNSDLNTDIYAAQELLGDQVIVNLNSDLQLRQKLLGEMQEVLNAALEAQNVMNSINSLEARKAVMLKDLELKNQELLVTSNAPGSGAFYYTLTNDAASYPQCDDITTKNTISTLDAIPTNTWMDLFSASEKGSIICADNDVFSLYCKKPSGSKIDLSLRLIIDDGLWILEAHTASDYESARFLSVPLAPNPDDLVLMTYDQWKEAINNPFSQYKLPEYVIHFPMNTSPSMIKDKTLATFRAGLDGKPFFRPLTQIEINEQEENYMEALQTLNLSPKFGTENTGTFIQDLYGLTTRSYQMPHDNQIRDALLGRKPFANMEIPTRALSFQIGKVSPNNLVQAISREFPFAIQAAWGFRSSNN